MEQREFDAAKFEGRVEAQLENIGITLIEIKDKIKCLDKGVNGMKVKVAAIGGTISLVVTVLLFVLKELLAQ